MRRRMFYAILFLCANVIMYCFVSIPLFKLIRQYEFMSSNPLSMLLQSRMCCYYMLNASDLFSLLPHALHALPVTAEWIYVPHAVYLHSHSRCNAYIYLVSEMLPHGVYHHTDAELELLFRIPDDEPLEVHIWRERFANGLPEVLIKARKNRHSLVEIYSMQERFHALPGEAMLAFFRIHNPTRYRMACVTIYIAHPSIVNAYPRKVQCFCFELMIVGPNEWLDLPVLFYISPAIHGKLGEKSKIILLYILFPNPTMDMVDVPRIPYDVPITSAQLHFM
jgi:hypothetical protein